jgi:hypothetical protein
VIDARLKTNALTVHGKSSPINRAGIIGHKVVII